MVTANQTKIMVILEGLRLAVTHNFKPLEINTDSNKVLHMLQNDHIPYNNIILEYSTLKQELGALALVHICKENDSVADNLASEGAKSLCFEQPPILQVHPVYAVTHITTNILVATFPRKIMVCNNF